MSDLKSTPSETPNKIIESWNESSKSIDFKNMQLFEDKRPMLFDVMRVFEPDTHICVCQSNGEEIYLGTTADFIATILGLHLHKTVMGIYLADRDSHRHDYISIVLRD